MIPHLVPEIEGGYPERDGEEGGEEEEEGGEGLVLENSRSWIDDAALPCRRCHHRQESSEHIQLARAQESRPGVGYSYFLKQILMKVMVMRMG